MIKKFIERPVMSTVISLALVILGIVGVYFLPINLYPDIAPPTIKITATFPGASSVVVQESVIAPIEKQVNGVEGMMYMTSFADNNGRAEITVYFQQGTNPDVASTMVQSLVEGAKPSLPKEVLDIGITTKKVQSSMVLVGSMYSETDLYDEAFIQNYFDINIAPKLQRVPGTGLVSSFGSKEYSMRIWLDPQKMNANKIVPTDIAAVLAQQNLEAAPGILGQDGNEQIEYVLSYKGRGKNPSDYENMIIRSGDKSEILYLKDVATVELGAYTTTVTSTINGKAAIGYAVYQIAGSNSRNLVIDSKKVMEDLKPSFPVGLNYQFFVDTNEFLDASIEKVLHTLLEAFLIVFVVVLIFLCDLRSTIIPAIAVPVSIVGTFFFLNILGYSINILTLFAMVLAIGIVVDDAIVVVEAVHAKLDKGEKDVKKATIEAMNEITTAIISITLVMSAVFLPVTLFDGSTGVFFQQFGITLFIAIMISGVNALTLSPTLCAMLLKRHSSREGENLKFSQRYAIAFNALFDSITAKYSKLTRWFANRRYISIFVVALFIFFVTMIIKVVPTGFIPNEDQGEIFAEVNLAPGATLARTNIKAEEVAEIVRSLPEVKEVLIICGYGLISGGGSSHAILFVKLNDWDQRKGKGQDVSSLIAKLYGMTANIKDASVIFFSPPTVAGFSIAGGFELQFQDKYGGDITEFDNVSKEFIAKLSQQPEVQYASTSFSLAYPKVIVEVDAPKCDASGVAVSDVLSILQGYIGSLYTSTFNKFGFEYKVLLQAKPEDRGNLDDLNKLTVRNKRGEMIPITQFLNIEKTTGPENVRRFNMYNSIYITGNPNPGYTSGDAITAVSRVAQDLNPNYTYEYSGMTREQLSSQNTTVMILIICVVFIYLILAAQYESYILPLSVLLSLPFGMFGAFVFAWIFGVENNIYFQLSLLMLIGLLAKNAILIIEFAKQRREQGLSIKDAAIEAAEARLRPILMTSFACIFGLLPLAAAMGVNSLGNRSIGIGAVGGLFVGTMIGVVMIPSLFVIFQGIQEKISKKTNNTVQSHE